MLYCFSIIIIIIVTVTTLFVILKKLMYTYTFIKISRYEKYVFFMHKKTNVGKIKIRPPKNTV